MAAWLMLILAFTVFGTKVTRAQTPASATEPHASAQNINRPNPFGFKPGMTKDAILTAVGGKTHLLDVAGNIITLNNAPKPNPEFNGYMLAISSSAGLGKVLVWSDVESNRSGEQVRDRFSTIRAALVTKYGKPGGDYDFVHAGALFREDDEFMMSLLQGERDLVSFWTLADGTFIFLKAVGKDTQKASIQLSYEFHPEFDSFSKVEDAAKQATY